jgi:sulfonate transport system ATP-binding protein
VRVCNLIRRFGDRRVLHGLDLSIIPGEFVVLLGASSCGKSTLLRILADLDRRFTGEVAVPVRRAVAFQAPRPMPWKPVWRNIVLGLPRRPDRRRAIAAREEAGLGHRADVWPKVLSGGQAQRHRLPAPSCGSRISCCSTSPAALDALARITAEVLIADLWQQHGCVLVMKNGAIGHELRVDLPRPRNRTDEAFVPLRQRLFQWLGWRIDGA